MFRRIAVLVISTAALFAVSALGQSYNSGYGWWPGGYGNPPVTVQAPTRQCSVTAYGPTFVAHLSRQDYGGSTSCQGAVGHKQLTVSDQVRGSHGVWYTISGSTVALPYTYRNPVRVIRNRPAVLGHVYRTVATATIVAPNGHAGCSLHHPPDCSVTYHLKAISKAIAP